MTFLSQNVGARKYSRIDKVFYRGHALGFLFTMAGGLFVFIFREQLMRFYSQDADIIALGSYRLHFMALMIWADTAMGAYSGALRGLGKAKESMIISVCAICGFRVLWLLTAFRMFREYTVILMAWPASWIVINIIYFFYYRKVRAAFPREDAV